MEQAHSIDNQYANDIVKAKLRRYKDLKNKIDALDREAKSIRSEIISFMDGRDRLFDREGILVCRYKEIEQGRFDSKRFKEDFSDIYIEYTKKVNIPRFEVKL